MITHYPVLESLVAFAIVFLVGYLAGVHARDTSESAPRADADARA